MCVAGIGYPQWRSGHVGMCVCAMSAVETRSPARSAAQRFPRSCASSFQTTAHYCRPCPVTSSGQSEDQAVGSVQVTEVVGKAKEVEGAVQEA